MPLNKQTKPNQALYIYSREKEKVSFYIGSWLIGSVL